MDSLPDKNFIEHHQMVCQLLEEYEYSDEETIFVSACSYEFNAEMLHSMISELRYIQECETPLGITCSASGLALRAFSTEAEAIEVKHEGEPMMLKAFGDTYVIASDNPYGDVYAGFINSAGEQHFRRLFFRHY